MNFSDTAPPGGPEKLSVTEVTQRIKATVEARFGDVSVEGEVLSLRRASSGHCYFILKDDGAQLPAVIWRQTAARLQVQLSDGMKVIASGDVQVYPPHGRYQLVVRRLVDAGLGARLAALETLKKKLLAEGLFDPSRKRRLPLLPRRVGVVTAATGAALRDILRTLEQRYPTQVLLYPSAVQGPHAPKELARGVETLAKRPGVDVIIVGRGGGSVDDLWSFNDEALARAIAACPVPVVSAVGHEIDHLLTDFVADARAATPTAAAELVVPDREGLREYLDSLHLRMRRSTRDRLRTDRLRLVASARRLDDPSRLVADRVQLLDGRVLRLAAHGERLIRQSAVTLQDLRLRLKAHHPTERLRRGRQAIGAARARLLIRGDDLTVAYRHRLNAVRQALHILGPMASLERGYAIVRDAEGQVLRGANQTSAGAPLTVLLAKGGLDVRVEAVHHAPGSDANPSDPPPDRDRP